jgi:hypothetical protein
MTEKNHKQTDMQDIKHDETRDQLDDILDAALAKYAAEPRTGLEDRVLANLRTENAQASNDVRWRWWQLWQWTTAAAVAVGIVVAVFMWRSVQSSHPAIANRPAIATPAHSTLSSEQPATQIAQSHSGDSTQLHPHSAIERHPHSNSTVATAAPKLDQFPSPQPLSEQEKILADYVAQFHAQAVLIARVTNEELKRDRIEVFGNSENPNEVADHPTTNR